jgi:hypothetical protein
MKAYGGVDVYTRIFFTSASRPSRFNPGEKSPDTHWIGGCVGPKAGLDYMEKWKILPLPEFKLQLLGHPARSQSLYLLLYAGSNIA